MRVLTEFRVVRVSILKLGLAPLQTKIVFMKKIGCPHVACSPSHTIELQGS